ncbi:MAG: hypothetical protein V1765_03000 [bacterium]
MLKIIYECMMAIKPSYHQDPVLVIQFFDGYKKVFNGSCHIPKTGGLIKFRSARRQLYQDLHRVLQDLDKGDELKIYNGEIWGKLFPGEKERWLKYLPLTRRQQIGLLRTLKSKAEKIAYIKD